MSTDAPSTLPIPEEPLWRQWVTKEEFKLSSGDFQTTSLEWVRPTRFGTPKCKVNGQIKVVLTGQTSEKDPDKLSFSMSVTGSALTHWANITAYDIDEETLVKRGRQIEMKLVDAWRELSY
jgi:hypothetical protein